MPDELISSAAITFRAQRDRRQVVCVLTGGAERRGAPTPPPSANEQDQQDQDEEIIEHELWPAASRPSR